jgi:hypothetical protein
MLSEMDRDDDKPQNEVSALICCSTIGHPWRRGSQVRGNFSRRDDHQAFLIPAQTGFCVEGLLFASFVGADNCAPAVGSLFNSAGVMRVAKESTATASELATKQPTSASTTECFYAAKRRNCK